MSLHRLLYPRSIAIVGASDKIGPGFNAWNALAAVGFDGPVYLINPKRDTIFDRPCHPSLADVPGEIDAVFVAVPYDRVLDVVRQAAAKGAGGLAILSSGFAEGGEEGVQAQRQLVELAGQHGLAVCGPNCLGFLNMSGRTALFGTSLPERIESGGVAAVVQSGSVGIALLNASRGIGLSHLITSGNEAVTTVADYLGELVDDPQVRVIAVFLEQLRKPQAFIEHCRRARAAGKPVVVLKSGRSTSSQKAVMAHTGAVAGSVEVSDAVLREAGAVQAFSLDELIETVLLFSSLANPPRTKSVAMVSLSGGEIALALDAAEEAGLQFPPLASSREKLAKLLPPHSHIANPLDLTWAGLYDPGIARQCVEAMGREDDVGLMILLQDTPRGLGTQQATRYANLLKAVAAGAQDAGIPAVAVSNLSSDQHPVYAEAAEATGIACLRGTKEGIRAVAEVLSWHAAPQPSAVAVAQRVTRSEHARKAAAAALARAHPGRILTEHEAKAVMAAYGIPALREHLVETPDQAAAAADRIGYPVVVKGMAVGVAHKSELGLVRLNLRTPQEVIGAAEQINHQMQKVAAGALLGILVQEMVQPVVELLVGARLDPDFGPVIVIGGGGLQVELFSDVCVRLAPVSESEADAMLAETRTSALLEGWRGGPKADRAAVARTASLVSQFIVDFADEVDEVEFNPFAVLKDGRGGVPLDCVIVRRRSPAN